MTPPTRPVATRRPSTKARSKASSNEHAEKSSSSRSGGLKSSELVAGSPVDSATTAVDRSRPSTSHTIAEGSSRSGFEPADAAELDALWDSIRQKKEKRLAKERPKVQSLEQVADEMANMQIAQPQIYQPSIIEEEDEGLVPAPLPERQPRRRKSVSSCRESTDGKSIVMVFDMTGVCKEDIHVGFQKSRLMLTWATAELAEWEEEGVIMRERSERINQRTIPLADGTRFEEVHGQMHGSKLVLRFPNMRCIRVEAPPLRKN